MLPPDSIFRCMPTALQISLRRLMGGVAYAFDGAELYYERLLSAARQFYVPGQTKAEREAAWTAERRLGVVMDAWAFVDNLNRLRQIVSRFPYGDPRPECVNAFLAGMDEVRLLRNRIQHLDEDYQTGANFELGYPVFGALSWVDTRFPQGMLLFGISSGPAVEGGTMQSFQFKTGYAAGDVSSFSLIAFDRTIDLDEAMQAARSFMAAFEDEVRRTIVTTLRDAAASQGIPLGKAGICSISDMIIAMAFRENGDNWRVLQDECSAKVEVPIGNLNLDADST